jgi:hypothetical protein
MTSTLVITSKLRHFVGSSALTKAVNLGTALKASPAETVRLDFKNDLRSITPPIAFVNALD